MTTTNEISRERLDIMHTAAWAAVSERDSFESWLEPGARAAQRRASDLFSQVERERARLFKLAPWGSWMTKLERQLATITGTL